MSVDSRVFVFGTKSGLFRRESWVDSQIASLRHASLTDSCGPHDTPIWANRCSSVSAIDPFVDVDMTVDTPAPAAAPVGVMHMDSPPLPLTADAGQSTVDMAALLLFTTPSSLTNRFVGRMRVRVCRCPDGTRWQRGCGSGRVSCATHRH